MKRYPVVLIHYEGNTSAEHKNLPHPVARKLCGQVIQAGFVPVVLDWDNRSPPPDGKQIHNPHVDLDIWGGLGTGDAEVLAALTELSSLMIGVDSGPLHVAGATSTPTIAIWTRHHPLHYFGHADNVTHLVPSKHQELLRGDRDAGSAYFRSHYRYRPYDDLEGELKTTVDNHLRDREAGLVYTRNFWIRSNNAAQDLVVVQDIAENDSYRISELPMPEPVVVDVGAHIGCFSQAIHDRNPLARIFAVECCPENLPALRKNIGGFATVIQGAMTYDSNTRSMVWGLPAKSNASCWDSSLLTELHCSHGAGNGLLLPFVMRFNLPRRQAKFAKIAQLLGAAASPDIDALATQAITAVEQLKRDIGIPQRIRDIGGNEEQLRTFAEKAFAIKRLLWVNPRAAGLEDLYGILQSAF